LADRHDWPSFHALWATALADDLNRRLPSRFLAEAPSHLGSYVETDVAEYETNGSSNGHHGNGNGGVATAVETYAPPVATAVWAQSFLPVFQVKVYDLKRHRALLTVIELVSPANKDRPINREVFAAKYIDYLLAGVGLIILDVVTDMGHNLHNEMVRIGDYPTASALPDDCHTYAAAYRPVYRKKQDLIDVWPFPLAVGEPLPTVPLSLRGYGCVAIDLEKTYEEACERCRIE
jgi:hypothetical protein